MIVGIADAATSSHKEENKGGDSQENNFAIDDVCDTFIHVSTETRVFYHKIYVEWC